jgi:hypothetical protein
MKLKAIFKHNDQVVAEYPFDVKGNPKSGTSGDLAERAMVPFDEFARKNSAFPLVDGDVWIKFETVK